MEEANKTLAETKESLPAAPAPTEEKPAPVVPGETNESFLGSLLVFALVILLVGTSVFFGFFGYRIWKESQRVKNTPSIEHLADSKAAPVATPVTEPTKEEAPAAPSTPSTPEKSLDRATLEVKVMNGGAPKGSAGTFSETLKRAGYAKTTFGNTVGDFTGTTIYFAEGKEAEAEFLKTDIVKTYPAVKTAAAIGNNKDTTGAMLVVVLGKQ